MSDGTLGIGRPARHIGFVWAGLGVAALAMVLALPAGGLIGSLFFVGVSFVCCVALVNLVLAKGRVLREREVIMWKGLAKMISWNPTEGVVFLRDKQIAMTDDNPDDGGGIRVIYPLLGEELALRVPLEIQTLAFGDSNILTKEYLPLSIKGTIYWKIRGIDRFYLQISKDLHSVDDRGTHSVDRPRDIRDPKFEVAEQWLRAMAEEKTRAVVSQVGTGLLIADQLASDLSVAIPESSFFVRTMPTAPAASDGYRGATDGLANAIKSDFAAVARSYGLEIHEVRLQEVRLPAEIYAAAVDACKSAYLPLKARAEAIERKLKLQAEADVIGRDATGMKEIAANIPALAFQEFLSPLFLDFNRKRGLAASTTE